MATNILNFTNGKAKLLVSRDGKVVDFTDGKLTAGVFTISTRGHSLYPRHLWEMTVLHLPTMMR